MNYSRNRTRILEQDVRSMQRDVDQLVRKTRSRKLAELQDRSKHRPVVSAKDMGADDFLPPVSATARNCGCTTCLSIFRSQEEKDDIEDSQYLIQHPLFPCMVMSVRDLRSFAEFPTFERATELGMLHVVSDSASRPDPEHTVFISHVHRCNNTMRRSSCAL